MIIPLKRDGEFGEWAIIELQGDLKFDSVELTNDQYTGDIHFTKSGMPILVIGIHILYGKEMVLPKPFAVLERKQNKGDDSETKTEYLVKGIVRKKLVFKTRPKPIITNVPKCH